MRCLITSGADRQGTRTVAWARASILFALVAAAGMVVAAATAAPAAAATARASSGGAERAASSPTPVVLIVMESGRYQGIVGSSLAPFINGTMIAHGRLATNYFAIPGSLADYLLMVSGRSTPPPGAPNLFGRLGHGTSWREFMESMPSTCYRGASYHKVNGTNAALYARKHNPAIQFSNVAGTSLCDRVVPLLHRTFDPARLPRFSFVVPNECNDMHTQPANHACPMWNGHTNRAATEVKMGDQWLASFVPLVAKKATVVVTWDEAIRGNEHVPTILYGLGVRHGRDGNLYHHASLEAGLYRHFRLGVAPGQGATIRPLLIP